LIVAADVMPTWIQSGLTMRDEFINENPILAQMVVDALMDTNRWSVEHPEELAEYTKITLSEEDMDDATRMAAIAELIRIGYYPVNGGLEDDALESFVQVELATGGLEPGKVPPFEQWVDRRFLDDYLARNGTR
jgi:ABC-type nitrate/sulfonate/bicarbonate transport system substrate-binding protein